MLLMSRCAHIQFMRWHATKQDTARHLKVFSQDTSADKIKDGITREEPFVNKSVPLALPSKKLFEKESCRRCSLSCYEICGVSIFLKSEVMRCAE